MKEFYCNVNETPKDIILQPHELKPVVYDTLLKQAEVAFKAGQESRQDEIDLLQSIINSKDVAITDLKSLLELAKEYAIEEHKVGVRDMAEWVEKALLVHPVNRKAFRIEWLDKMKEWGIS